MLKKIFGWLILIVILGLYTAAQIYETGFTAFIIALLFGLLIAFAVYLITVEKGV